MNGFTGVERGLGKVIRVHNDFLFNWAVPLVVDEYEEVDGRKRFEAGQARKWSLCC